MLYKYVFESSLGNLNVKTPKVEKFSDIKITIEKSKDCIHNHSEYPNGLIIDSTQYADKVIWMTNKRIILLSDGTLGFED
ncbi:MAG: hypothetical protein HFI86_02025 [Bacilli bacterium]|nr:hypothetical protein [Bacilli bacterium]